MVPRQRTLRMPRTRLALIGCGGMSKGRVSRFDTLSDRVQLVAAVDVVKDKAEAVKEHVPDVKVATDYREVLDDVDAALLVLPHHLHHPIGMACLEAGVHVLLEKPMAISEQQCLDLISASEESGAVLMIAYCMRYHPLVVRMKELLDEKAFGDGQFFSHGCHYVDILLWFLGRPVRGTHMGTNFGTPWMEEEGTSNLTVEFEGARLGYHFGTWGARGTRLQYSIHAHCTEGMLDGRFRDRKLLSIVGDEQKVLAEGESGKHTENEMAHFLDCIDTGGAPLTDGPGSLQGLRLIWRLNEAGEKGAVADLRGLGLDEYTPAREF